MKDVLEVIRKRLAAAERTAVELQREYFGMANQVAALRAALAEMEAPEPVASGDSWEDAAAFPGSAAPDKVEPENGELADADKAGDTGNQASAAESGEGTGDAAAQVGSESVETAKREGAIPQ